MAPPVRATTTNWSAVYDLITKNVGADYLKKLSAQDSKIDMTSVTIVQSIVAGELDWTPFGFGYNLNQFGDQKVPLAIVYPKTATLVFTQVGWVHKKAAHPNAGLLLENYLMCPEGQAILNGNGEGVSPIPDVKGSGSFKAKPKQNKSGPCGGTMTLNSNPQASGANGVGASGTQGSPQTSKQTTTRRMPKDCSSTDKGRGVLRGQTKVIQTQKCDPLAGCTGKERAATISSRINRPKLTGTAITFPFLEDFSEIFGMLMGEDATLVRLEEYADLVATMAEQLRAVAADAQLPDAERQKLAQKYGDQAMGFLKPWPGPLEAFAAPLVRAPSPGSVRTTRPPPVRRDDGRDDAQGELI